jgi:lipopolysaccharide export system protein LptC
MRRRLEFATAPPDDPGMSDAVDVRPAPSPPGEPPPGKGRRTPSSQAPGARDRLAALTEGRESAFPDALRHTARVARLRRLIFWGVGGTVGIVGIGLLASSVRLLPIDLNLSRIALKGTRIVIETPKLVGYRKDGKPYEVRARVGVQDITSPDVFDLDGLDVRVESEGEQPIVLTAAKAHYSTKSNQAKMHGGVVISDKKNFEMRTAAAEMDFSASVMTSDKRVVLTISGGEVEADSIEFSQKELRATFSGNVHSVLYGEDGPPPQGAKPDARTPVR